jgi:hypothetical protein
MAEQEFLTFLTHLERISDVRMPGAQHELLSYYAGSCVLPSYGPHPWNASVLAWQRTSPNNDVGDQAYSLVLRQCVPFDNGGLLIGSVPAAKAERTMRNGKEWLCVPGALADHMAYVSATDNLVLVQLGGTVLNGMLVPWGAK